MAHELTDDLNEWVVTLRDGVEVRLLAHAYSEEGSEFVFSALMRGKPNYEIHLARIPRHIVASVFNA